MKDIETQFLPPVLVGQTLPPFKVPVKIKATGQLADISAYTGAVCEFRENTADVTPSASYGTTAGNLSIVGSEVRFGSHPPFKRQGTYYGDLFLTAPGVRDRVLRIGWTVVAAYTKVS